MQYAPTKDINGNPVNWGLNAQECYFITGDQSDYTSGLTEIDKVKKMGYASTSMQDWIAVVYARHGYDMNALPKIRLHPVQLQLEPIQAQSNRVSTHNRFCANCGKELPENAAFCVECGVRVS